MMTSRSAFSNMGGLVGWDALLEIIDTNIGVGVKGRKQAVIFIKRGFLGVIVNHWLCSLHLALTVIAKRLWKVW